MTKMRENWSERFSTVMICLIPGKENITFCEPFWTCLLNCTANLAKMGGMGTNLLCCLAGESKTLPYFCFSEFRPFIRGENS